jgi:drug/metabolite transporter (DMT)-like permease
VGPQRPTRLGPGLATGTRTGPLSATAATSAIGVSVAVSELLIHDPVVSAQAVRSAIGATALLAVARLRHQRLPRPTGRDLALLLALGATGLAGFNILLLAALRRVEPAAVGVVVGCVPVLLALAGPLLLTWTMPAAAHSSSDSTRNPVSAVS